MDQLLEVDGDLQRQQRFRVIDAAPRIDPAARFIPVGPRGIDAGNSLEQALETARSLPNRRTAQRGGGSLQRSG